MANQRVTRVLCAADPMGSAQAIERLLAAADDSNVQAVVVAGNLKGEQAGGEGYRSVFKALGKSELPVYWVPGPDDAPVSDYLREAQNIEVVFQNLRGVHGTAAFAPAGHVVFGGLGGEIVDDPDKPRVTAPPGAKSWRS
jgi:Icc-related predicted phosphoesterase